MLALFAIGAFVALAGAFLAGRAHRKALSEQVRAAILPYLRRRAAQSGLEVQPEDPRAGAADSVREACALAQKLTDLERRDLALGATMEMPKLPK
ncbi:MAG TPA: hypothetical protein VKN99_03130 [Polyangia bacterium]|nr:hypothetical protein [Polyangia bacterium]